MNIINIIKETLISEKEFTDTNYDRLKNICIYKERFDRF